MMNAELESWYEACGNFYDALPIDERVFFQVYRDHIRNGKLIAYVAGGISEKKDIALVNDIFLQAPKTPIDIVLYGSVDLLKDSVPVNGKVTVEAFVFGRIKNPTIEPYLEIRLPKGKRAFFDHKTE